MKVVFVHSTYPSQFTEIANNLAKRQGWECSFLVSEDYSASVQAANPPIAYYGYQEERGRNGAAFYLQNMEEGTRRGKAVLEALAHLRAAAGIDVVVGHASFGTTFFVREILNLPVVSYVELPGYFSLYCRGEFPIQYSQRLVDGAFRALVNASVLNSNITIVPSAHAKSLFPPELRPKIRVCPEGFKLPPLGGKAVLRREAGLDPGRPVVGFAARTLEAVRGFDTFVDAAKIIKQTRPDVQFLVIGDETTIYGNETGYLGGLTFKQYALNRAGLNEQDFIFKPFLPYNCFIDHLKTLDIALFPIYEGAANWGLFEAMAAGAAVVASKRCFVPEVVTHGQDGLLLEAGDFQGFAGAVLTLLEQPELCRSLGRNARNTIAARFSLDRAAEGYAEIIREAWRQQYSG